MNLYGPTTSRRIADDRIVCLAFDTQTGKHLIRCRNGALKTEFVLSNAAMLALVEMYFQLHEREILLMADDEMRTASVAAARAAIGRCRP